MITTFSLAVIRCPDGRWRSSHTRQRFDTRWEALRSALVLVHRLSEARVFERFRAAYRNRPAAVEAPATTPGGRQRVAGGRSAANAAPTPRRRAAGGA